MEEEYKPKKELKYKRLKIAIVFAIINVVIFIFGIQKGVDLSALGTGLSLINAPIYAFILGDSFRPSNKTR